MMNKTLLILIAGLFFSTSQLFSQEGTKKTTVSGKLTGNETNKEISLRAVTREVNILATAPIGTDGSFSLEFPLSETNLYRIFLSDNNYVLLILQPGEKVTVTLNAASLTSNPEAKGSEQTELYWNFSKSLNVYNVKLDSIGEAYKLNMKTEKSESLTEQLQKDWTVWDKAKKDAVIRFITDHPASLIGLVFVDQLDIDEYFSLYDTFDQSISKAFPNNVYVKDFHGKVEAQRIISVGSLAPELSLPDPQGQVKSLSSLKGKIVLVDFWAAWCGPCRKENPHVVELYHKYHDSGFEVFGVSLDRDSTAWKKAIKDDGLIWTQVSDLKYWKSEAAKAYGVSAIPFTVLLDKEGRIIGKKLRGEALSEKLKEIFGF